MTQNEMKAKMPTANLTINSYAQSQEGTRGNSLGRSVQGQSADHKPQNRFDLMKSGGRTAGNLTLEDGLGGRKDRALAYGVGLGAGGGVAGFPSGVIDDEEEARDLLALTLVDAIGARTIRALVAEFGSAKRTFEALRRGEMAQTSIRVKALQGIIQERTKGMADMEMLKARRSEVSVVPMWSPHFPAMLNNTPDGPVVLFRRGNPVPQMLPSIAVVGTRKPSAYGVKMTEEMVRSLSEYGFHVVSGLAYGVDTIAHVACLKQGGITSAVLGNGLDTIYPAENTSLARAIIGSSGSIWSEQLLGAKPDAHNFPARNRIIAGMCHATLVVEAYEKGGALITAHMAFDQDRAVFAVPGPLDSPSSRGSNKLIRDCIAKLVMDPAEIVEELKGQMQPGANAAGLRNAERERLKGGQEQVTCTDKRVVSFDELQASGGQTTGGCAKALLLQELQGAR